MNKVLLVGNLGQDAELKVTPGGQAVLNLRLATSERWKDKTTGEKKEATEWHSVELWGQRAESLAPHLRKGQTILVEGSIHTRSYEKDGSKRYTTSIKAQNIEFVGSSGKPSEQPQSNEDQPAEPPPF